MSNALSSPLQSCYDLSSEGEDLESVDSLDIRNTLTEIELSAYMGDCVLWLSSIGICFCHFSRRCLSPNNIRRIHDFVKHASEGDCDLILTHFSPWMNDILASKAGFYLMQTIMTNVSHWAIESFINSNVILEILTTYHGCKLVEFLLNRGVQVNEIASRMCVRASDFWMFSTDNSSNFVVQQVVSSMSISSFERSLASFAQCAPDLATHPKGAYVLQAFLKKFLNVLQTGVQSKIMMNFFRNTMLSLIHLQGRIVLDKYGNFSAQEMIPLLRFDSVVESQFTYLLQHNLVEYTRDTFGHSVIETFLEKARVGPCRVLVRTVLELEWHDFVECMNLTWGPFVFRKLWARATGKDRNVMRQKLAWSRSSHF